MTAPELAHFLNIIYHTYSVINYASPDIPGKSACQGTKKRPGVPKGRWCPEQSAQNMNTRCAPFCTHSRKRTLLGWMISKGFVWS